MPDTMMQKFKAKKIDIYEAKLMDPSPFIQTTWDFEWKLWMLCLGYEDMNYICVHTYIFNEGFIHVLNISTY